MYLENIKTEEDIIFEQQKKEQIKLRHRKKTYYYDDIHQIAGDLRFIKNLIIIGLVCGFVLVIIGIFGLL